MVGPGSCNRTGFSDEQQVQAIGNKEASGGMRLIPQRPPETVCAKERT